MTAISYRFVRVDGLDIFYREAGEPGRPVVLLLHGFPSSSFMFRDLIPVLATEYHVIAPDYPGFGLSSFPDSESFKYTFDGLTRVIDRFLTVLAIDQFAMYIQDYGAPVGLRLALIRPRSVSALIVQNGNVYEEGLSREWLPLKQYWEDPSPSRREQLRGWLTEEGVRMQYLAGMPDEMVTAFSPDTWTLDWKRLNRPGNIDVQLDLFYDYRTNVDLYPDFQEFFREYRPPTLVTWGRFDPFFSIDGARAFLRDLPEADLKLFDGGHFLLETHVNEVAEEMLGHLKRAFLNTQRSFLCRCIGNIFQLIQA